MRLKRRKTRFSAVTFKLSRRQKRSLMNYCRARKTTPIKLIKKSIRRYIENFASEVPDELYVTENQLDLFDDPEED